ncbi:MAG: metalloregulator ArsR/SmtB family transcription factor [Acidobacteriota bacterium]
MTIETSDRQQKLKDRDAYGRVATILGALANPVRLEIVELLAQCERSVDALASKCNQPLKNVSHHLQKLHAAGIVDRRSEGRTVVYFLTDPSVATFWSHTRAFAEKRLEGLVTRAGGNPESIDENDLDPEVLNRLIEDGTVTVIDVRPSEEFGAGHLPGAESVPIDMLKERMRHFPKDKPVVAYCRGRYCLLAEFAVDVLESSGFEAIRFADGVIEWRDAGLDVERTPVG